MTHDSRPDEASIDRWLCEFRLNGFIVFKSFLDPEWVRAVAEQMEPLLRGELERATQGASQTQRSARRLAFDVGRYADLLGGPLADARYRRHPLIEQLVGRIFGPGVEWRRGWTQVECVWSGSVHMDWHSDQTMDETPDPSRVTDTLRLTYNIPLVDFTWANGAMEMIPGTHHLSRAFLARPLHDIAHIYPVPLRLRVGDALLRDGNVLHRGTPNLTDRPRPMLDQTYKRTRPDAP